MSQRLGGLRTISLGLALLLSLNLHAPAPSSAATPGVYIALGDSIAAGVGASLPRTRGNTAIVVGWLERLSGETVPYENLAIPGETATTFIDGGQLQRFRETVAQSRAAGVPLAAVSVTLGGNELLRLQTTGLSDRQTGLDDFTSQYAAALSAIRAEIGPDTPLVVTTYYDLTEGDATIQFSDAWWVEQFNAVIRRGAAEHEAGVADIATLFEGRIGDYTYDPFDVHPSNAGHLAIAQSIWTALQLDDQPPSVSVSANTEGIRSTPTVQFSVDDNVKVRSVAVRSDDLTIRGPFETGENRYALLLDLTSTDHDEVALTIEISDDAGNVTREVVTIQADDMRGDEST
ncbi:MAG: SGNH/GDSL hydrolase family protein [Chloroflexota bacterium]|nr:SGNH/GDSL hydrolase family protein [Chloroflexota bacterium]